MLLRSVLKARSGTPFTPAHVTTPGVPDATSKTGTKLVGYVDFANIQPIASKITPNPGGVGPMTIAMLLQNTVRAAELSNN